MKQPIHKATQRIKVLLLKLMRYGLKVQFVPGSQLHIADTLSRAYSDATPHAESTQQIREKESIHSLQCVFSLPVTPKGLSKLQETTAQDPFSLLVIEFIEKNWHKYRKRVPSDIRSYWTIRNELHVAEGLIFTGDKLVVPESQVSDMLDKSHEGRLGMEKCKSKARRIMYWPGMSRQIEDRVAQCSTCGKFKRANQREPRFPHPNPNRPWAKVGSGIFTFGSHDYLIVVDYFSKWPEVCKLDRKSALCHLPPESRFRAIWYTRRVSSQQHAIRFSKPHLCAVEWTEREDSWYHQTTNEESKG